MHIYTDIFCSTGLHSNLTEEKGMPKCMPVCQSALLPPLGKIELPQRSKKIYSQQPGKLWKETGKEGREEDPPCSEKCIFPTLFSLDLELTRRKQPTSLTMLLFPPFFLRVKVHAGT